MEYHIIREGIISYDARVRWSVAVVSSRVMILKRDSPSASTRARVSPPERAANLADTDVRSSPSRGVRMTGSRSFRAVLQVVVIGSSGTRQDEKNE